MNLAPCPSTALIGAPLREVRVLSLDGNAIRKLSSLLSVRGALRINELVRATWVLSCLQDLSAIFAFGRVLELPI